MRVFALAIYLKNRFPASRQHLTQHTDTNRKKYYTQGLTHTINTLGA
jgi:hypothetical protein